MYCFVLKQCSWESNTVSCGSVASRKDPSWPRAEILGMHYYGCFKIKAESSFLDTGLLMLCASNVITLHKGGIGEWVRYIQV